MWCSIFLSLEKFRNIHLFPIATPDLTYIIFCPTLKLHNISGDKEAFNVDVIHYSHSLCLILSIIDFIAWKLHFSGPMSTAYTVNQDHIVWPLLMFTFEALKAFLIKEEFFFTFQEGYKISQTGLMYS